MSFLLSPGIRVREIDLTAIVPGVSSSIGAIAGAFRWGPLNEIVTLGSEQDLERRLSPGGPDSATAISFFSAANFLSYANSLRVVRVADEMVALNATSDGSGVLIRNDDQYDAQFSDGSGGVGPWAAKFAGALGNSLKVSICPSAQAFSQVATLSTLGDKLTAIGAQDEISDILDRIEVGSLVIAATGVRRKITAITQGQTEDLQTSGTDITGSGTAFETTLQVGMILESAGELRRVVAITDDENAELDAAFTADLVVDTQLDSLVIELDSAFPAPLVASAGRIDWEYAQALGSAPTTSPFAEEAGGSDDEMHVVVVDVDGRFSRGARGTILERYQFVSKASDAKTFDGSSNYYADVVNRRSQFVRWMDHIPAGTDFGSPVSATPFAAPSKPTTEVLAGGEDGSVISAADKIRGYDRFADAERVDVSLIIGADADVTVASYLISQIGEVRQDCVVFLSPPEEAVVSNSGSEVADIVAFRESLPSSSYAVMDSGWKYMYDKYSDVFRWMPLSGDTAGLCAQTDFEAEAWFSPAGFNRGIVRGVTKLAYEPNQADRDDLYVKGINPVVSFSGLGTVLYGDKTLLAKPSAFDRINVRRLFNVLKKSIRRASQFTLFEQNDQFTRSAFVNLVEPFLRDIQGRRGIQDFRVIADETNNTAEVIDRNEFVGDIFVKPTRSINFIRLNFIAVRTGAEFTEIVGLSTTSL